MGKVPAKDVMQTDYSDLEQVKRLARKLGPGNSVIYYPGRLNYNITHTERLGELPANVRIIYRS